MKRIVKVVTFILALLALTASLTPRVVEAQGVNPPSTPPTPMVVATTEKNHTFEDRDWPIIRTETQQIKDPNTGETHIVTITVRQAPKDTVPPPSNSCPLNNSTTTTDIATSGCSYYGAISTQTQDARLGGVVSNITHYAYQYCYNSICDVYQPYKIVEWWTRSDANWTVQNAVTRWGSGGSWLRCTTGQYYSYIYTDGPFTPSWSGNISYYHIFNSSNWPQMQPTSSYPVIASIASDGYHYGNYVGGMWAEADFYQ